MTRYQGNIKRHGVELEDTLEQCVLLFSHMSDKDLFAQLYRDALSKRLLNKKSKSSEAERAVISRLKLQVMTALFMHYLCIIHALFMYYSCIIHA